MKTELAPSVAWVEHVLPDASSCERWLEDSKKISSSLGLSKRELFALIVLATVRQHHEPSSPWLIGYDPKGTEPNDGYVCNMSSCVFVENKLVPRMEKREVLNAIKDTYRKYAAKGESYGGGRALVIYCNAGTEGHAIEISQLHDEIASECPFDQVYVMHAIKQDRLLTFALTEHFPSNGLALVRLHPPTGALCVVHSTLVFA